MTKQKATTRDKLLACAIIIAFMSLNIVLGSFFSPGSWSPAVVTTATPPTHPQPPSNFASIDGAITYAQQSGFTIINLFNEYAPLSKYGDAVGAEILYLAFSHIAELDKNASLTVTGSATEEALTLTISALTDRAPVLGARHMGEIRALATSVGGSVDTDTQAASWTLTARLPAAADAPS